MDVNHQTDLAVRAREIIDSTLYMALGTADENGLPWVSPVYFAPRGYTEFYWISSPETTHSRNIAGRPEVSVVVFDSRQVPGSGRGVYMSATAGQLAADDVDEGLEIFNGRFPNPVEHGLWPIGRANLAPTGPYLLYRATVSGYSMLCPRESGRPCAEHGRSFDHRTQVSV